MIFKGSVVLVTVWDPVFMGLGISSTRAKMSSLYPNNVDFSVKYS